MPEKKRSKIPGGKAKAGESLIKNGVDRLNKLGVAVAERAESTVSMGREAVMKQTGKDSDNSERHPNANAKANNNKSQAVSQQMAMNGAVEALKKELDAVSNGSVDSSEDLDHLDHAIEEASRADEGTQFFDAEADSRAANAALLSPEEREQLEQELKKTEDEIGTLRQVLTARMKHSQDLKHKLGISPWAQVTHDMNEGLAKVKETNAYQKTTEVVHQTTDVVQKKLGQLRNSNAYKSFEQGIGTAYSSVKAKISASTSMNHLYGNQRNGTEEPGAATQPTTPNEKSPLS